MSDMTGGLIGYAMMMVVTLAGAVVMLERDGIYPYRALSDEERKWVARAGLACPLWPITALAIIGYAAFSMLRMLVRAARGVE